MKSRNAILLLLLTLVTASLHAQETAKDSARARLKDHYLPTGIRFGVDAIPLIQERVNKSFSGWELMADADISRYFLTVEYGRSSLSYRQQDPVSRLDTLRYSNGGNYWRAGIDVNFLHRDVERNAFFIGLRYGRSRFDESFYIEDKAIWGAKTETYTNDDVPAHWFELTTGLKVRMWKVLWMGYTARLRFGLSTGDTPDLLPHDVPGYGRTNKETTYGFNYYIMARIPMRPIPPPPPKKKKR